MRKNMCEPVKYTPLHGMGRGMQGWMGQADGRLYVSVWKKVKDARTMSRKR